MKWIYSCAYISCTRIRNRVECVQRDVWQRHSILQEVNENWETIVSTLSRLDITFCVSVLILCSICWIWYSDIWKETICRTKLTDIAWSIRRYIAVMVLYYFWDITANGLQMHFIDQMLQFLNGRLICQIVIDSQTLEFLILQDIFCYEIIAQHIVFEQL